MNGAKVCFDPGQRSLFLAPVSSVKTTEKRPLLHWVKMLVKMHFRAILCLCLLQVSNSLRARSLVGSWGAFHLSELAGQTGQFVNGMYQFEG